MSRILGVDLGGVIVESSGRNADDDTYRDPHALPGAFGTLRLLRDYLFDEIHVISKCGEATEVDSRVWLAEHDFSELTGIPEEHWHFCRVRPDKVPIARRLGVTHYVDDRTEIIAAMQADRSATLVQIRCVLFRPAHWEYELHRARLWSTPFIAWNWEQCYVALIGELRARS